jgi:hypothetical protein
LVEVTDRSELNVLMAVSHTLCLKTKCSGKYLGLEDDEESEQIAGNYFETAYNALSYDKDVDCRLC